MKRTRYFLSFLRAFTIFFFLIIACFGFKSSNHLLKKSNNKFKPKQSEEQRLILDVKNNNRTFAGGLQSIGDIYKGTRWHQDFFIGCGGLTVPQLSCGLGNKFYGKLAKEFGLPEANLKNVEAGIKDAERNMNHWSQEIEKIGKRISRLKFSKRICAGKGRLKKCRTIRYPGKLRVPKVLKKKAKKWFKRLKKNYNKARELKNNRESYRRHFNNWKNTVVSRTKLKERIDKRKREYEKSVVDAALRFARDRFARLIKPTAKKLVKKPLSNQKNKVVSLSTSYLRNTMRHYLKQFRARESSALHNLNHYIHQFQKSRNTKLKRLSPPFDVMAPAIHYRLLHALKTCWSSSSPQGLKTCTQNRLHTELHGLTDTLLEAIYLHTSERFLYWPCAGKLANKATTKAAKATMGLSCLAFNDLRKQIHTLLIYGGKELYRQSIASTMRNEIKRELNGTLRKMAKDTISPIPLSLFTFRHQKKSAPTPKPQAKLRGKVRVLLSHFGNRYLAQKGTTSKGGVQVVASYWKDWNTFKWHLEPLSGNLYRIKLDHFGNRYLTQQGTGYANGANVVASLWRNLNTQKWRIHPLGGDWYKIEVAHGGGRYLSQQGTRSNSGVRVVVSRWKNWNTYKWRFQKIK